MRNALVRIEKATDGTWTVYLGYEPVVQGESYQVAANIQAALEEQMEKPDYWTSECDEIAAAIITAKSKETK